MRPVVPALAFVLAVSGCSSKPATVVAKPVVAAPPPEPVEKLVVHVLALQTEDADDHAEGLTKAVRAAIRGSSGWELADSDFSMEVLSLSLQCAEPPDAECMAKIAEGIKGDRYVWGTLAKGKTNNVVGVLNLWQKGSEPRTLKLDYSANLTEWQDEALRNIATDSVNQLTRGIRDAIAKERQAAKAAAAAASAAAARSAAAASAAAAKESAAASAAAARASAEAAKAAASASAPPPPPASAPAPSASASAARPPGR